MSDTESEVIESQEAPVTEAPAQETPQEPEQRQPETPYQGPVDLGHLPEDIRTPIENRINHLSRLMKKNENRYESKLSESQRILQEQSRIIDELTNGMGQVVNHIQENSFKDNETELKAQMRTAYESGNTDAYLEAQNQLDDLRLEKKLMEREKKTAPQKPEQKQVAQPTESFIDPEDSRVVNAWQSERDASGVLLRPWAHNKSNDPNNPDHEYIHALAETRAVFTNPRFASLSMQQKIEEVDRRMGTKKQSTGQSVMGGGLTTNRKSSKITLSPKQQEIAIKTKFGGPKAKSEADHFEAYRKQIERVEKMKGAR